MAQAHITDGLRVPEMLTVTEAARILHVGRTAAYQMAKRWLETNGQEGIPARRVGRLIRIPSAELEQHLGIRPGEHAAAVVQAMRAKRSSGARKGPQPSPPQPLGPANQHPLPFTSATVDAETHPRQGRRKASHP
jgi:excisionase family DNA binding protein